MCLDPPLLLLVGLLLGLTAVFWVRWRPGTAPPPPAETEPAPAVRWQAARGRPLHLLAPADWEGGSLFELGGWEARRLRAVAIELAHRHEYVKALEASRKLEQDFAADFTDHDRLRQAVLYQYNGEFAASAAEYDRLLNRPNPYAPPVVYNNRGYVRSLLGEYAAALPDFDAAIRLDASHAFAHNNRGLAHLRLGHPAEALADIRRSLRLDPGNAYAHRNLGIWHFEQQQWPAALTCLTQAHAINPDIPELAHYLQATRERLQG